MRSRESIAAFAAARGRVMNRPSLWNWLACGALPTRVSLRITLAPARSRSAVRAAALSALLLGLATGANPALALCGSYEGTLPAAGSPYSVTCDLEVQVGNTLTIPAGVELRFDAGTSLIVHGMLTALGTATQPIRFGSAAPIPALGDWNGIDVFGNADIQFAEIAFPVAGLSFFPGSGGSVTETDFVESGHAIWLSRDVWVPLGRLSATGSGLNGIWIVDGYDTSGTLTNAGIPYLVLGEVRFAGPSTTIEPGVVFKSQDFTLMPFGFAGDLTAEGTAAKPIVFTSLADDTVGGDTNGDGAATTPIPGEWYGLELYDWNGLARYRLRHLDVRWGLHGVVFRGRGDCSIADSTFTDIVKCPVILDDVSPFPSLSGLTATGCQGGNGIQIISLTTWGETTWTAGAGVPYIPRGRT
jgi:hypothetical protein